MGATWPWTSAMVLAMAMLVMMMLMLMLWGPLLIPFFLLSLRRLPGPPSSTHSLDSPSCVYLSSVPFFRLSPPRPTAACASVLFLPPSVSNEILISLPFCTGLVDFPWRASLCLALRGPPCSPRQLPLHPTLALLSRYFSYPPLFAHCNAMPLLPAFLPCLLVLNFSPRFSPAFRPDIEYCYSALALLRPSPSIIEYPPI